MKKKISFLPQEPLLNFFDYTTSLNVDTKFQEFKEKLKLTSPDRSLGKQTFKAGQWQ